MTHDEIVAAYKFAGVPDPERMAAAFEAANPARDAAIHWCPRCAAPAVWTGGLPDGGDTWRCADCGHKWATP